MNPWSNYPKVDFAKVKIDKVFSEMNFKDFGLQGLAKSYGDVCLAPKIINLNKALDHFTYFNPKNQLMRVEANVTLDQILQITIPHHLFLPVTPGTRFITVAGAVANDIHGKNHHIDGTFGNHVTQIGLLKTNGERLTLSPTENTELFNATIGGLGLTGIIEWVEFKLKKIESSNINQEVLKFRNLSEFLQIAEDSKDYLYTVAWVDCLARGENLGRGLFIRGDHANDGEFNTPSEPKLNVPFFFPQWALNKASMKAFNFAYYNKQLSSISTSKVSFEPFFYPLDSIKNWNRIYGKEGFLQYQFVLPFEAGEKTLREIFTKIADSGMGSFLAVLKTFGNVPSPGMLSFPREGVTLALDFPMYGEKLFKLLNELDEIIMYHGGRIYPAKDARMSPDTFKGSFPNWEEFQKYKDPKLCSRFWARVMELD